MANKKLDKLFQEQLKNLEVSPNESVWNNIEAKLVKKKSRVFPLWWFSGAVASILVLGLLFYPFYADDNQNINTNSKEIITKKPEINTNIQDKIEKFKKEGNNKNEILISKEEKTLNPQEKIILPTTNVKSDKIYQSKKIQESIAVFQLKPLAIHSNILLKNVALHLSETKIIKNTSQKINIEDVVKEEENNKFKKTNKNWSVAPTFAILQSNSLTDSSPINANLASSTSGENSYSYGVQVAYKLNHRWSIQSGIHRQEISYANNQVIINRSSERNPFATQFSNGDSFSFNALSSSVNNITSESVQFSRSFFSSTVESRNSNIIQNYGYIEIPVELKYNFSTSAKFQTQLVTGFSGLFLNKNQVTLNTQNFSTNLEADNLNSINFSGNLGFDFNYFFNKSWSFNLNPMFKVQLNTFSNGANGFAPFQLGLYSGIRFQF